MGQEYFYDLVMISAIANVVTAVAVVAIFLARRRPER